MRQVSQIQFQFMFLNLGKLEFPNNVIYKFCIVIPQKNHILFFSSLFISVLV